MDVSAVRAGALALVVIAAGALLVAEILRERRRQSQAVLDEFAAALEAMARQVGAELLPALKVMAASVTPVVEAFRALARSLSDAHYSSSVNAAHAVTYAELFPEDDDERPTLPR